MFIISHPSPQVHQCGGWPCQEERPSRVCHSSVPRLLQSGVCLWAPAAVDGGHWVYPGGSGETRTLSLSLYLSIYLSLPLFQFSLSVCLPLSLSLSLSFSISLSPSLFSLCLTFSLSHTHTHKDLIYEQCILNRKHNLNPHWFKWKCHKLIALSVSTMLFIIPGVLLCPQSLTVWLPSVACALRPICLAIQQCFWSP